METTLTPELLLVVFVHGFKGTDETFAQFPQRLQRLLTETINDISVMCTVFPAYETKGDLNDAVAQFADWLTTLTVEREVASGGGAGSAKVVLCGHSMGGLLIADALLEFISTRPNRQVPLWPRVIACIAFDTPFLGLHPNVFKNSVTKATEYASAAKTVGSTMFGALAGFGANKATTLPNSTVPASNSLWGNFVSPAAYAVGGAILAGAAAGGAYYQRGHLNTGVTWATDHLKYVGNLWDEVTLKKRINGLMGVEKEGVIFRIIYALIPANPPFSESRTFIILPKRASPEYSHFIQARNGIAPDELQAHTGMFSGKSNDGYYDLGLVTAKIIRDSVTQERNKAREGVMKPTKLA